ncbi:MAG TPA: tRNA (adenosine(37)-N6)-threonylcarbamoyltransferase complex dimerization subunit type 1 TsaB [Burkholderiales bacterium]|nr:tRNA (adenosine(37)-N6)-threonylcarbamoyltransferase complex dimerization subunit type 1 TsaB [Burkholderiales bacterium]
MRFAALETSTQWCSVALHVDGETRALERRAGHRHSELALPMLHALLRDFRIDAGELQAVAFGAGPGSFTGLRIACGLAQGLALARGLPVLGVSSFEAIAEESGASRVVACLDARMREVYYAALENGSRGWREVIGAQCIAPAAAPRPPGEGWIGCGGGFAAFPEMARRLGLEKTFAEVHPGAAAIARLAAPRLARGEGVDAAQAAPTYLRDKVALTRAELA